MFPTAQASFGRELIQFEHSSNEERDLNIFCLFPKLNTAEVKMSTKLNS